jgi:hypothetical protein
MENDGISQSGPRKVQLDEAKVCQLMATLTEMWPDVGGSKPELKVVATQRAPEPRKAEISDEEIRSQLVAYIRKTWPDEFAVERPEFEVVSFKEDPESRNLRVTIADRKKRRDQLKDLLDEAWGPVQNETPKPRVDRVMVDRLKGMIRATWPDEFGGATNVVHFPRAKKRGAKARRGPCAELIRFRCGRADYSDSQRRIFDFFIKDGRSARFAAAMIDFTRRPKDSDDGFVRGGISIADYIDQLTSQGI